MTGIAWNKIAAAAELRLVTITAELAGYLLLGVVEALAGKSALANPDDICLDREGRVLVRRPVPCAKGACDKRLRELLKAMLKASSSSCSALSRVTVIDHDASDQSPFVEQLQKALIPLNRAAARRALSRLHRELVRAESAGKFGNNSPAWLPAAGESEPRNQPTSASFQPTFNSPSRGLRTSDQVTDLGSARSVCGVPSEALSHAARLAHHVRTGVLQIPDLVVPTRSNWGDRDEDHSGQAQLQSEQFASSEDIREPEPALAVTAPLELGRPAQVSSDLRRDAPPELERTLELPRFGTVAVDSADSSEEPEGFVAQGLTQELPRPVPGTVAIENPDSNEEPERFVAQGSTAALPVSPARAEMSIALATGSVMAAAVVVASIERTLPLPVAVSRSGDVPSPSADPFFGSAVEPTRALPLVRRRRVPSCLQLDSDDPEPECDETSVDCRVEISVAESLDVEPRVEQPRAGADAPLATVIRADLEIELEPNPEGVTYADSLQLERDADFYEELDAAELMASDEEPCVEGLNKTLEGQQEGLDGACAPSIEELLLDAGEPAIDLASDASSTVEVFSPELANLGCSASSAASEPDFGGAHATVSTQYCGAQMVRAVSHSSIEGLSQQFAIEPLWSEHELSRGLRVVAGFESASGELSHTPPPMVEHFELERPEQLEPTRRLGRARTLAAAGLVLGATALAGQLFGANAKLASASPAEAEPLSQICRASIKVAGVGPEQRVQIRQQGDHHFRQPSRIVGETASFSGLWCARDTELLVINAGEERLRRIPIPSERLKPHELQPWVLAELHID